MAPFDFVDVDSLPPGAEGGRTTTPRSPRRRSTARQPVAGDEGLEFVTFGAPVETQYQPPSWG